MTCLLHVSSVWNKNASTLMLVATQEEYIWGFLRWAHGLILDNQLTDCKWFPFTLLDERIREHIFLNVNKGIHKLPQKIQMFKFQTFNYRLNLISDAKHYQSDYRISQFWYNYCCSLDVWSQSWVKNGAETWNQRRIPEQINSQELLSQWQITSSFFFYLLRH